MADFVIEPKPHALLPSCFFTLGMGRIELPPHVPETCILPLYYIPIPPKIKLEDVVLYCAILYPDGLYLKMRELF